MDNLVPASGFWRELAEGGEMQLAKAGAFVLMLSEADLRRFVEPASLGDGLTAEVLDTYLPARPNSLAPTRYRILVRSVDGPLDQPELIRYLQRLALYPDETVERPPSDRAAQGLTPLYRQSGTAAPAPKEPKPNRWQPFRRPSSTD